MLNICETQWGLPAFLIFVNQMLEECLLCLRVTIILSSKSMEPRGIMRASGLHTVLN